MQVECNAKVTATTTTLYLCLTTMRRSMSNGRFTFSRAYVSLCVCASVWICSWMKCDRWHVATSPTNPVTGSHLIIMLNDSSCEWRSTPTKTTKTTKASNKGRIFEVESQCYCRPTKKRLRNETAPQWNTFQLMIGSSLVHSAQLNICAYTHIHMLISPCIYNMGMWVHHQWSWWDESAFSGAIHSPDYLAYCSITTNTHRCAQIHVSYVRLTHHRHVLLEYV